MRIPRLTHFKEQDLKAAPADSTNSEVEGSSSSPSDPDASKKSSISIFPAFTVDKKPKKRVTWAPEDSLQQISYFEVDETERGSFSTYFGFFFPHFICILLYFSECHAVFIG